MPKMIDLIVNPEPPAGLENTNDYKWSKVNKPRITTTYVNAMEILRNQRKTGEIYVIAPSLPTAVVKHEHNLDIDKMTTDELKTLAFQYGYKPGRGKKVSARQLREWMKRKMSEFEVVEEDDLADDDEPVNPAQAALDEVGSSAAAE